MTLGHSSKVGMLSLDYAKQNKNGYACTETIDKLDSMNISANVCCDSSSNQVPDA